MQINNSVLWTIAILLTIIALCIWIFNQTVDAQVAGVSGHAFQFATPVTPEVPDIPGWIARLVALIIQIIRDILANL